MELWGSLVGIYTGSLIKGAVGDSLVSCVLSGPSSTASIVGVVVVDSAPAEV